MLLPTPDSPLRIGTRGSALALAQAAETRARLMAAHGLPEAAFQIVPIRTTGDRIQDRPLRRIGGKGLFTREIEEALLAGVIDIAVHSMKDMPTLQPKGLVQDCHLPREDFRDAFVTGPALAGLAGPDALPDGAVIGTSSLRRRAQLLARRPDLRLVEFRGNVQTRLQKLQDGTAAATILAMAGLNRLGLAALAGRPIAPEVMLPAVAQGAIGIERRQRDRTTAALLAPVADHETGLQMAAERAYLAVLEGSCETPIGGLAILREGGLWLRGEILRPDGTEVLADEETGALADAAALGRELGRRLRARAPADFFAL